MMRGRLFLTNTLANAGSSLFGQAMALLTLPLLLKQVGLQEYGIYALATSAMGYFSIFSLMARASVVKYISEYQKGEEGRIVGLFNSALAANALIGLLIGGSLFLMGFFCESIFRIETADLQRAQYLFYLHAGAAVLLQPLFVFASLLYGLQRYGMISLIDGLWTVVRSAVILAIYFFEGTIFWLAWTEILCHLIKFTILAIVIRFRFPFVKFDPHSINLSDLKKIAFYGAWSLLYTASLLMVYQGSMLLIGILLSVPMITYYQIAYKLYNIVHTLSLMMNAAVLPASSSAIAGGEKAFIEKLITRGTRYNLLILLFLAGNFMIFSDEMIRFWIGPEFVHPASALSRILLAAWFFLAPSTLMTQVYWGQKRIAPLSLSASIGAAMQFILLFHLADSFGLSGIAAANATYFAFLSIASLAISSRALNIEVWSFLKRTVLPVMLLVNAYLVGLFALLSIIGRPQDLFHLFLFLSFSGLIGWAIGFATFARDDLQIIFRLWKKAFSAYA